MELPTIQNILRDNENKIIYHVMAYRSLTREELLLAVRNYLASSKKKPKKGSTITIISIIGASE
jgi:hypothetical protein